MKATRDIVLLSEGQRAFDAYLAMPAKNGPGILIMTEMFGLNGPMRELADGYAARGFVAMVPNLFWRSEAPRALAYEGPEREIAWARLRSFDADAAAGDVKTAADWLRSQPFCNGRVAVIGFCAGGRMAYLAATRAGVDAAVSFYGLGIAQHVDEASAIGCPVQLHYGMKDPHVPTAEIEAVAAGLATSPAVDIFRYDAAGHSFFNPVRPTYDASAASLAAERVDSLLDTLR